jgi:predicted lipid-binding transport protein (Tim44 family)
MITNRETSTMRRSARLLAAVAVVALALAPTLAMAKAGGGTSAGSRGSRTYSAPPTTQTAPTQARPVERSMNEGTRAPGAAQAARPGMPPAAQGSWMQRNPFMAGLLGGALGAGLIGMFMGGGLAGGLGGAGFAGVLGLMLQLALIGGLVMLAIRFFRRRAEQAQPAGAAAMAYTPDQPRQAYDVGGASSQAATTPAGAEIQLGKPDFDAFEANLKAVQDAWSKADLRLLGTLSTPEMVQYFADDLAANASKGVRNEVSDVALEGGDLAEAWHEYGRDYATVAMRFSMLDVTRRVGDNSVVEGDLAVRSLTTELWTFMRTPGGKWLLSAIQQTA